MICPNCGREIPDGTVCPCTLEAPALSDNPAVNVIKRVGSSGMFLALCVLFSAWALLTIFSSLGVSDALANIYMYAYQIGMNAEQIMPILDLMQSSTVTSAVLGSIPAILTAAAMWIHFSTCRNRLSGNISTAGLTICKVLCYISMISLCVLAFLILGGFALIIVAIFVSNEPWSQLFSYGAYAYGYSQGPGYTDEEATIAIVVVLGVFALIITFAMVLAITYQASFIRMINRTKNVALTGLADDRVSGYLTGMSGFVAACSIISGFGALLTAPIAGAATLCHAAGFIVMILLLRKYKNEMNMVLYPSMQPAMPTNMPPAYGQPPYQPGPQPPETPNGPGQQ